MELEDVESNCSTEDAVAAGNIVTEPPKEDNLLDNPLIADKSVDQEKVPQDISNNSENTADTQKPQLSDSDASKTSLSTPSQDDHEPLRISSHPNFLCVAQFIGTFGTLLGLPPLALDAIEDGIAFNPGDSDNSAGDTSYLEACSDGIQRLLISLLRRCNVNASPETFSETLCKHFSTRDVPLHKALYDTTFHELEGPMKLNILRLVCLGQFDENPKFKGDFNSTWGPEDLRFLPFGRDRESAQYWFISDREKDHRLYRWSYPYSSSSWALLSSSYLELMSVMERLRPREAEHELRKGKMWQLFCEEQSAVETATASAVEKQPKKLAKKRKQQKKQQEEEEQDEDVEFRVKARDLGQRKSLRCLDTRKVYTEDKAGSASSEEENVHKETDDKYKMAINMIKSRKRQKHIVMTKNAKDSTPSRSTSKTPAPLENRILSPVVKRDPFAFKDDSSRTSTDSHSSASSAKNGVGDRDRGQFIAVRKVIKQQSCGASKAFQSELLKVPTLREVTKPTEAEDRCWKCDGTEDVDKMLFCDGCDLATYHMACLSPPIIDVPDDDWYCPICEQTLLFFFLRKKLALLVVYTYTHVPTKLKERKSVSSIPRSTAAVRTPSKQTSSSNRSSVPKRTSAPARIYSNRSSIPHLITPSKPPSKVNFVTPRYMGPRPKIRQIGRLTEHARRVYDHSLEEDDFNPGSDSESEVVQPERPPSAESSSDDEFSYRPMRYSPRYRPEEYFAQPSAEISTHRPEGRKLGYNPLGSGRTFMSRGYSSLYTPTSNERRVSGIPYPEPTKNADSRSSTGSRDSAESRDVPRDSQKPRAPPHASKPAVDTATALLQGKMPEDRSRESSRSGNVVTQTGQLTPSQRKALEAWENEERNRKKDAFDFDE